MRSFKSSGIGRKLDWTTIGRATLDNEVGAEWHNEDGALGFEGASVEEEDVTVLVELMGTFEGRIGGGRIENGFCNKGALESETDDIRVEFIEPQLHRQVGKPRALQLQQLW